MGSVWIAVRTLLEISVIHFGAVISAGSHSTPILRMNSPHVAGAWNSVSSIRFSSSESPSVRRIVVNVHVETFGSSLPTDLVDFTDLRLSGQMKAANR